MSGWNERKLDELFAAYRESLPDREPGVNFTPELWRRIDQRRKANFSLPRFARGFVTAAMALCFGMMALNWTLPSHNSMYSSVNAAYTATYVDVLDDEPQNEADSASESL